jgi:hypothetical protein
LFFPGIAVGTLKNLSSRPERTRISYLAELATTTDAALLKKSRTRFINATKPNRKSGGAEWRDLRFLFSGSHRDSSGRQGGYTKRYAAP